MPDDSIDKSVQSSHKKDSGNRIIIRYDIKKDELRQMICAGMETEVII